jgi:hypothetical protein
MYERFKRNRECEDNEKPIVARDAPLNLLLTIFHPDLRFLMVLLGVTTTIVLLAATTMLVLLATQQQQWDNKQSIITWQ